MLNEHYVILITRLDTPAHADGEDKSILVSSEVTLGRSNTLIAPVIAKVVQVTSTSAISGRVIYHVFFRPVAPSISADEI